MGDEPLRHILVVEDNPDTQLLLKHFLSANFTIHIVNNVRDALIKIEAHNYTLLLVDINLGEERTGIDLLNLLRENDLYANLPLVAITAYAMPGDDDKFIKMGFDAYVSKPFSRVELYAAIDSILDVEKR